MLPRHLSRVWKKGGFIRRLSGMTLEPSTAARGVASWISSLQGIRASHSASPGGATAIAMRAISGRTLTESYAKRGQLSLFSRTSPGISAWVYEPSQQTFKAWVTGLRRASLERMKSARRTAGSGSSLWPTPTVIDAKTRGYSNNCKITGGSISLSLPGAVGAAHVPRGRGGHLNPDWVAKLMGLPDGWDDVAPRTGRLLADAWGDEWEAGTPRVAEDPPHRVDRIRALGNAVVPQTAALAFRTLLGALIDG